jgi:hypothetical protein
MDAAELINTLFPPSGANEATDARIYAVRPAYPERPFLQALSLGPLSERSQVWINSNGVTPLGFWHLLAQRNLVWQTYAVANSRYRIYFKNPRDSVWNLFSPMPDHTDTPGMGFTTPSFCRDLEWVLGSHSITDSQQPETWIRIRFISPVEFHEIDS